MRLAALVLGLGFLTVGCGGASTSKGANAPPPASDGDVAYEAPASPGNYAPQGYASPTSESTGGSGAAASAPAPPPAKSALGGARAERSTAAADAPPAQEPARRKDRPGLGTEWGEARTSRIREVTFVRGSDEPSALLALHYNDREGASALASFRDARPVRTGAVTALGGAVRVTVEDERGAALDTMRIGDRTVVVGAAGQRYSIVLTNRTGRRFETVVSVDGLDVITGRPAAFDQRGYVVLPFATLRIEGFRQSDRSVAAFRFSRVADSYAAQTGSARNVGVIGVAFFKERGAEWTDEEIDVRDTATPFPNEPSRFAQPPR